MMKVEVFVSYANKDADKIAILKAELDKHKEKLNCFIALKDLHMGDEWVEKIFQAIESSHIFLFCLSENSIRSIHCHTELFYARLKNKPLIPISLEKIDNDFEKSVKSFFETLDDTDGNGTKWSEFPLKNWNNLQNKQRKPLSFNSEPTSEFQKEFEDILAKNVLYLKEFEDIDTRAKNWDTRNRLLELLLTKDKDINKWQKWLRENGDKHPSPDSLQQIYIDKSIEQKGKLLRRRWINLLVLASALVIVVILISLLASKLQQDKDDLDQALISLQNESRAHDVASSESLGLLANEKFIDGDFSSAYQNILQAINLNPDLSDPVKTVIPHIRPGLASYKHIDGIDSVAISHDGQYILAGGNDGNVILWNWKTCPLPKIFSPLSSGLTSFTSSVAFSPDGSQIVAGFVFNDEEGIPQDTVFVWSFSDFANGIYSHKIVGDPDKHDLIRQVQYSPNGHYLGIARGNQVELYTYDSKEDTYTLNTTLDASRVFSFAFNHQGNQIVTLGSSNLIWTINPEGKFDFQLLDITIATQDEVWPVIFSKDDQSLLARTTEGSICVWGVDSPLNYRNDCFGGKVGTTSSSSLAAAPDGIHLLTPDTTGDRIAIWDYAQRKEVGELYKHSVTDPRIAISGQYVVTGALEPDSTVRVWDWQLALSIGQNKLALPDMIATIKNHVATNDKCPTSRN